MPKLIDAPEGTAPLMPYPEELIVIGVDTDHKEGEHPYWDARCFLPLEEGMVLNIMALGVSNPVEVEPSTPEDRARLVNTDLNKDRTGVVVDGRRRVLHAREANRRLVALGQPPIRMGAWVDKNEIDEGLMKMISGNEFRLNETPTSRAKKAVMMLKRNVDIDRVAIAFGVTKQTIKTWKRIAELPDDLAEAVDAGKLRPTAAVELAKRTPEERQVLLGIIEDATEVEVEAEPTKKKKAKTKKAKKPTVAAVRGVRGKKFYKTLVNDFGTYLPEEFVLGVKFAQSMVTVDELPAKIKTQVMGCQCVEGEIDEEALGQGILRQIRKMYKAEE